MADNTMARSAGNSYRLPQVPQAASNQVDQCKLKAAGYSDAQIAEYFSWNKEQ